MSKALCFIQITAEHQDCPCFTVFITIKTSSQNISIALLQIPLKLTNMEEKASVNDFGRTVPSAEKSC